MRRASLAGIVLGLSSFLYGVAHAADLHVPSQYPSIAAALAASAFDDHIVLACGTYHEHLLILRSGVTLRSESGDPACVTLDGDGANTVCLASGVTEAVLEGLTIRNGYAYNGGGMRAAGSEILLRRCRFYDNRSDELGSAFFAVNGALRFEEVVVAYNHTENPSALATGAVAIGNAYAEFVRCTIVYNTYAGTYHFWYAGGVHGGGYAVLDFDRTIVALNAFPDIGGQAGNRITYDCFFGGDPLFCDAAARDFHLNSASPCLPGGQCPEQIGALGHGCGPVSDVTYTVTTAPPGRPVLVDGEERVGPATFVWQQFSDHMIEVPDMLPGGKSRELFESWSDGGDRAHVVAATRDAHTWTANYRLEHFLSVQPPPGGTSSPASGWFADDASVTLSAASVTREYITGWEGSGDGSYTGPANPVDITVNGPISQIARSAPISYEFSVSASDTDPFVNSAPAEGGGRILYLWLTCSRTGLSAFETYVTGTLLPLAFEPLNSVLNVGTPSRLLLAVPGCPTGENVNFLLGRWFVQEPSEGGTLCLGGAGSDDFELVPTGAVDCQTVHTFLVRMPGVTGFSSTSATPCRKGRHECGESGSPLALPTDVPGSTAVAARPWELSTSPNPFHETATLRFALPAPGRVKLSIYDVSGRLVRRLVEDNLTAGAHERAWNGRDSRSFAVPSGVYFVRLVAGDRALTRKILRLVE